MGLPEVLRISSIKSELKSRALWRDCVAEMLATFFLMAVQAALPLTWGKEGMGGAVQVGLGVGFIVATMAWALGDFGGGHINPAVSVAMIFSGKITIVRGLLYIIAQLVGAVAGAAYIYGVTPEDMRENLSHTDLGPGVAGWQGFLMELLITWILVLTIYGATNDTRKASLFMPTLPIGFAVALGIMTGFNHTGGSMNPARSFGPAAILSKWDNHWVYWAGPITGGICATLVYHFFLDRVARPARAEELPGVAYKNVGQVVVETEDF